MNETRSQLAVVLDEHGGTAGIVTVEDLFEEVVGEFGEDPGAVPEVTWEAPGRLLASGSVRLDRIGEAFGVAVEHDEVDTVGGLVLSLLGRPASAGDTVRYRKLLIEVLSSEGRGVRQVRVGRDGS